MRCFAILVIFFVFRQSHAQDNFKFPLSQEVVATLIDAEIKLVNRRMDILERNLKQNKDVGSQSQHNATMTMLRTYDDDYNRQTEKFSRNGSVRSKPAKTTLVNQKYVTNFKN
jgi:GTP-sensing pleiotropic transcriptional regulator CodY